MAEENTNTASDVNTTSDEPTEVAIPAETYDELLDRLEALEEENISLRTPKKDDVDLDSLLEDEPEPTPSRQEQKPIDFENLSNGELANVILGQVENFAKPIMNKLYYLEVKGEIKECQSKHDDFDTYAKEIQTLATKKPTLSIEEAYSIVKSKHPAKPKDESEEGKESQKRTATERLLNLPKRKVYGEKPTITPSSTTKQNILSTRDAAEEAWEEVMSKRT